MAWRDGNNSIKGVMEAEIPQFTIVRYKAVDRIEKTSTGKKNAYVTHFSSS